MIWYIQVIVWPLRRKALCLRPIHERTEMSGLIMKVVASCTVVARLLMLNLLDKWDHSFPNVSWVYEGVVAKSWFSHLLESIDQSGRLRWRWWTDWAGLLVAIDSEHAYGWGRCGDVGEGERESHLRRARWVWIAHLVWRSSEGLLRWLRDGGCESRLFFLLSRRTADSILSWPWGGREGGKWGGANQGKVGRCGSSNSGGVRCFFWHFWSFGGWHVPRRYAFIRYSLRWSWFFLALDWQYSIENYLCKLFETVSAILVTWIWKSLQTILFFFCK